MSVDYAELAADYDLGRADESVDRGYWLPALVDVGRIRAGDRILDIGAGTGRFAQLLASTNPVVAFDRSLEMLTQARSKGPYPLVRGDAHRLPFRRDAFDVALLVMVLHHLPDYPAALREVARVSRRVAIATTDMRSRRLGILEEAFPSLLSIDRARFPSIQAVSSALKAAGFPRVDVQERPYRRMLTAAEQLERVRRKYISTLHLLPPEQFERGVRFLERELPARHPDGFPVEAVFTFLGASR